MISSNRIETIIFDLGGVLIDWNPKYLYRKIFETEEEVDYFLDNIYVSDWNVQQDAGRPFQDTIDLLTPQFPKYKAAIQAYKDRWVEMLNGEIQGTLEILKKALDHPNYRVYALTNWSQETFPIAVKLYPCLSWFEGVVVSGVEKVIKPDPKIYEIILDRYNINAGTAVFIDDSLKNVKGAEACGIKGIHFSSPERLNEDLKKLGVDL